MFLNVSRGVINDITHVCLTDDESLKIRTVDEGGENEIAHFTTQTLNIREFRH